MSAFIIKSYQNITPLNPNEISILSANNMILTYISDMPLVCINSKYNNL